MRDTNWVRRERPSDRKVSITEPSVEDCLKELREMFPSRGRDWQFISIRRQEFIDTYMPHVARRRVEIHIGNGKSPPSCEATLQSEKLEPCKWCEKGDRPHFLDSDGTLVSITGNEGVLSHAHEEYWWPCLKFGVELRCSRAPVVAPQGDAATRIAQILNEDRCMWCGGKTEHEPDCDHGVRPSPVSSPVDHDSCPHWREGDSDNCVWCGDDLGPTSEADVSTPSSPVPAEQKFDWANWQKQAEKFCNAEGYALSPSPVPSEWDILALLQSVAATPAPVEQEQQQVQCADCLTWVDRDANHTCRQQVRHNTLTDNDLIARRTAVAIADAHLKDVPETVDLESDRNLFAAGYLAAAGSIKAGLQRTTATASPSLAAREAAEELATRIVGNVFHNTAASHQTLRRVMIERIADYLSSEHCSPVPAAGGDEDGERKSRPVDDDFRFGCGLDET